MHVKDRDWGRRSTPAWQRTAGAAAELHQRLAVAKRDRALRPRKSEKRSIVGSHPAAPWASCSGYKTAFSLLEEDMPPKHRLMLVVHYHAPARTVTARQLAALVGYAHYGAVNMQYGTLARGVCEILGQRLKYHVLVLVEFRAPVSGPDRDLRWIMRPEVARALEELQWV